MSALGSCSISRTVDGAVEIVDAAPEHRSFPPRVNESLGICLKFGPAHDVSSDGRHLVYPTDAICVRSPGCTWSVKATGPVGFLSIDIAASLLPAELVSRPMAFAPSSSLPRFEAAVRALRTASPRRVEEIVVDLLLDLSDAGLARSDELGERGGTAARAREVYEARLADAPSLADLAATLGTNRFALSRAFKRHFGITPHAFVMRLRVERARERLARGHHLIDVAHDLGFADQPHFSRVFKDVLGITPADYARRTRRTIALSREGERPRRH